MTTPAGFEPFNRINIATQTVIVHANCHVHLPTVFAQLPTLSNSEWVPDADLAINTPNPNQALTPGSIIGMKFDGVQRGITVLRGKAKRDKEKGLVPKRGKEFRNCIVVDMYLGPRESVNFKLSRWGRFHLTGCKTIEPFVLPVLYFLRHMHVAFGVPPVFQEQVEKKEQTERKETDVKEPVVPVSPVPVPVQRVPTGPRSADWPGYQCFAVVAMSNAYISLPHSQDLSKLKNHILKSGGGWKPMYEPGFTQCLSIKAGTRLTPEETKSAKHTYFSVLDADLMNVNNTHKPPAHHLGLESAVHLHALETLTDRLKLLRTPVNGTQKKRKSTSDNKGPAPSSMLLYETRKLFISASGLEIERLYRDFCLLMTQYYASSSAEEKAMTGRSPASLLAGKRRKAASLSLKKSTAELNGPVPVVSVSVPVPSVSVSVPSVPVPVSVPVRDALSERMKLMRERKAKA